MSEYRQLMDALVSLYRLRESRGLTQVEVAEALDVTQGNVSRVEHASDLYVSTLAKYVNALGGRLELKAVFPDEAVPLSLPRDDGTSLSTLAESNGLPDPLPGSPAQSVTRNKL